MAEGIGLGNNGDQVDTGAQALHNLDVERLEGVSSGADEVQAGVHTHVNLVATAGLLLLEHVGLVLVVQELNNGLPRVAVVDVVTEAGGINNGQANCEMKSSRVNNPHIQSARCKQSSHPSSSTNQSPEYRTFEELLLQLGLGDLDLDGAVDLLLVAALVVGIVFDGGREEGVDEGSLSQSRLSGNLQTGSLVSRPRSGAFQAQTHHNCESRTPLRDNLVSGYRQLEAGLESQFSIDFV